MFFILKYEGTDKLIENSPQQAAENALAVQF
jgi:hypothetical protein